MEAHDLFIPLHPTVHFIPADITHDVIDCAKAGWPRNGVFLDLAETRRKAAVIFSIDKPVQCLTIGANRGCAERAIFVRHFDRFLLADRSAFGSLSISGLDVSHFER